MKKSIFFTVWCCLLIATQWSMGQTDSLWTLSTVEVTAGKIRQLPIGSPTHQWSAPTLKNIAATNIAQLLNTEAGSFIKHYGIGSLATASIRGGSAGHTLVLWNGLPVQSPMLGLLDLSFLPVNAVEFITFQKGGNSALWGSGAIGGVIGLANQADFTNRFAIQNQTTVGSFGYLQQQVKVAVGNKKFQSSTKYLYQKADNDFSYFIAPSLPKRQQENAHFNQQNILQDFYWQVNQRNQLDVHLWRQDISRAIPPTIVQTRSASHQEDWSNRVILNWKHIGPSAVWNIKTGFFDEYQDYVNDLTGLAAHNHFRSFFGELTREWIWKKAHRIYLGSTHSYTKAWSKGYAASPVENKSAVFGSWQWQQKEWQAQASIRQELVDGNFVPLVPTASIDYQLACFLNIQLKISKNYRLPTLNDRFWRPGGNKDLQAESGWSEELTIATDFKKDNYFFEGSLTGFNRQIDNWILWTLQAGQSFWSAHNLTKVWSKGLEPRLSVGYQTPNLKLQLKGGYDYIRSTNQIALETPRMAKGSQLIYTPMHQAFGKIALDWNRFYGSYQHQFTGATQGINESISAYQVGNVRLQYATAIASYQGKLFVDLHNVWDTNYVVVERRPMAGRHYQIGINILFQGKINK